MVLESVDWMDLAQSLPTKFQIEVECVDVALLLQIQF